MTTGKRHQLTCQHTKAAGNNDGLGHGHSTVQPRLVDSTVAHDPGSKGDGCVWHRGQNIAAELSQMLAERTELWKGSCASKAAGQHGMQRPALVLMCCLL